ncbi:hypothetical protein B0O80DRAFT_494812 [Mortierella sp. GBAus27b]|nr:hypothetical protein B0O80DRAFT_494812 [Mortierella sp. GBAus27b]
MHQNYRDPDFSAKVLVLGDSGVGKSSLVHMLCHNESLKNPMPTVGCNVDVRLHTYSVPTAAASAARSGVSSLLARPSPSPDTFSTSSTPGSDAAFVEFYDVSGSPTEKLRESVEVDRRFHRRIPVNIKPGVRWIQESTVWAFRNPFAGGGNQERHAGKPQSTEERRHSLRT